MNEELKGKLIQAAKDASGFAYAPYSNYKVGAAVLSGDGRIFTGCNVENSSYGLTNCAERTAIFKARSEGVSTFIAVAVYAPQPPVPTPCGACRQVMAEGGNNPLVIIHAHDGASFEYQLSELLPHSFGL